MWRAGDPQKQLWEQAAELCPSDLQVLPKKTLKFLPGIDPDHKSEVSLYGICKAFTMKYSESKWHVFLNVQMTWEAEFGGFLFVNFLCKTKEEQRGGTGTTLAPARRPAGITQAAGSTWRPHGRQEPAEQPTPWPLLSRARWLWAEARETVSNYLHSLNIPFSPNVEV